MPWNSVSEFFAMGGYAFYVWSSLGLTALVMLLESLLVRLKRVALLGQLRNERVSERTAS